MTAVGVLGAGLSGLAMGIELKRAGLDDFVIYDKQHDVGGTWLRNTYPGLHCDIPSHLYCYSFEPNPDWSMVYAGRAEIQAYLRTCAERWGLVDHIRFGTDVTAARYDEVEGRWALETADGEVVEHRVVVAATGGLTEPRYPRIEGLDRFEGPLWHAGAWRHDIDLAGRRVAVVGSAASAVQVVPAVADRAAEVVVFSRTPNWVMPRHNRAYGDEEKERLRSDPEAWRRLRRAQYRRSLLWQRAFKRHRWAIDELRRLGLANLRSAIDDPALIAALTPDYDPGCKRILVSDEYYPALARHHVRLVPRGVAALTPTSVVADDGTEAEVDAVVFCTGYRLGGRADGRPALDVIGPGGRELRRALAERPEAYRGIAVPGFPNYFTVCGINGAVAYAPVFLSAELETALIARLARRIVDEDLRSLEARADVTSRYSDEIQRELQDMSWTGACTNFYTDATGRVLSFFPGTVGRLRRELRSVELDDFAVERFDRAGPAPA
ncbi:MAG: flavin-containing monooxygenase [Acidimicrobiales bacterium]